MIFYPLGKGKAPELPLRGFLCAVSALFLTSSLSGKVPKNASQNSSDAFPYDK